jgi:DNA-binding PadR family transcriptional regulator
MPSQPLGETEEFALLVVVALGDEAYGVAVQRRLERDARRRLALGAVYAALERLEQKGYLVSQLGDATPQRGGRRKRVFSVTAEGRRAVREVRRTRERLWQLVEASEARG